MHSTHLLEHKGTYKVVQNHLLKTLLFFLQETFTNSMNQALKDCFLFYRKGLKIKTLALILVFFC